MDRMIVLKFGGSSVSSRESWTTIAEITKDRLAKGYRPLLVCSALASVSSGIERLLSEAQAGRREETLRSLVAKHEALGDALGVDAKELLREDFDELARLSLGISLIRDVSPKVKAQALSKGEMMSTKLGARWLEGQGIATTWVDARSLLRSDGTKRDHEGRHYLQASCPHGPDPEARRRLDELPGQALITQGFIAADDQGETVLLGRGGSDTSAALLASKLGAERLEIWTDVPGAFTADPREVRSARLLLRLGYDEAQELASSGAGVLHPRCIEPLREQKIPLHIRDTNRPEHQGTVISSETELGSTVKAVTMRKGLTLISMDSLGMWQQVGFLAEAFNIFRTHGISVEQVATSESNVTLTFDPVLNAITPLAMESLVSDLSASCEVRVVEGCVGINVVGQHVSKKLHRLAPAFELFEDKPLFLLSQAASDVNLTFVTEKEKAPRLVHRIHELIFDGQEESGLFGPTWHELARGGETPSVLPSSRAGEAETAWWQRKAEDLLELAETEGTPLYVYDEESILQAVEELRCLPVDRLFYAIKANTNPDVLRLIEKQDMGFECVSRDELEAIFCLFPNIDPERILFTPNFAPISEYRFALERGVHVTLDNLFPLEASPETFRGRSIWVRLDPGEGAGHHDHVKTAGSVSKFGIPQEEIEAFATLTKRHDVRVVGMHAHVGSGIFTPGTWADNARFLAEQARRYFPDVHRFNVGGGLGVREEPSATSLDLGEVARELEAFRQSDVRASIWMEPGRFLLARAGVLLGRVTQLKRKGERMYVGSDAGMNSLLRPALYGSFHEIVNLTKRDDPPEIVADIVGPICESGDVMGRGRALPRTEEGDILLIANAGAYGRVMASNYNLREPAKELLLAARRERDG